MEECDHGGDQRGLFRPLLLSSTLMLIAHRHNLLYESKKFFIRKPLLVLHCIIVILHSLLKCTIKLKIKIEYEIKKTA
jgi:hypothetical protein